MTNNDDLALNEKQLAHLKELTELMTERFSMNPVSCKILNEDWKNRFPDEVAIADTLISLLAERTADKAENASLRQRVAELETICADSYQVVGALADAIGVFNELPTIKALDNLSGAVLHHKDVLPFSVEARTVSLNPDPFGFARRSGDLVIIDVNGDPHIKDGMPLYAALLSPSVTCSVCSGSGRLHEPNEEPGDCSLCNGTGLLAAGIKLEVEE